MDVRTPALTALLLALLLPPVAAAPGRWIHEDGGGAPRLSVEHSIWALGGLPRGGEEWSDEEKVARIARAGFDGFMVFLPSTEEEQLRWRRLAEEHGLSITLQCAPSSQDDLAVALEAVETLGARGLVAMVRPAFIAPGAAVRKVRAMVAQADAAGVPFYVETHRGTVTQHIRVAERIAREVEGVRIHADLSHLVVSYGIGARAAPAAARALDAILSRTGMVDGRVSNGQQVQIDVGPEGDHPAAKRFAAWWKRAMVAWLEQAGPGDVFVFKPELGPPPYSIVGSGGREISDRWEQALVLREVAGRAWNEAVEETGRGQEWTPPGERVAGADAAGETAETGPGSLAALRTEPSGIPVLRGDSFKIGDIHLCGQPLQPDFDTAKEKGIRTVINLRLDRELGSLGFDERRYVEDVLGLEYHHFPVGPDSIDDELAEAILETIESAPRPLLIHDSNGNRVWGVWALRLGLRHGVPVEVTRAVAKEHGIRRLVIDEFVEDYLARKGPEG